MHTLLLPKFCAEAGLLRDFQVHLTFFFFGGGGGNWLPWLPVSDTHLTRTMTVHICVGNSESLECL